MLFIGSSQPPGVTSLMAPVAVGFRSRPAPPVGDLVDESAGDRGIALRRSKPGPQKQGTGEEERYAYR